MRNVVFFLVLSILGSNAFSQSDELESIKKFSRQRLLEYRNKLIENKSLIGSVNLALAIQEAIDSNDFSEKDIPKLTYENGSYWRAVIEKTPRDSSVLYAQAYLYAYFGKVAYSDIFLLLGSINVDDAIKKELGSFKELRDKLYINLNNEISEGIKLHDDGQYEKAIEIYDKAIEKYPELALPYYEKGLSCMVLGKGDPNSEWGKKALELYQTTREKDPFFWRAYQGSDPNVISQMEIVLEKVIPFYSGETRDTDSYMVFAEGCEEMELYPFASHAQLKLSLIDPQNSEQHLDKFFELIGKSGFKQAVILREMFKISKMAGKENQPDSEPEN